MEINYLQRDSIWESNFWDITLDTQLSTWKFQFNTLTVTFEIILPFRRTVNNCNVVILFRRLLVLFVKKIVARTGRYLSLKFPVLNSFLVRY